MAKSKKNNLNKTKSKSKKNSRNNVNSKTKTCDKGFKPLNIRGKLFCVGRCPHSGGPILYDPKADDLFCPWHNSRFDVKGKYKSGPASGRDIKFSK